MKKVNLIFGAALIAGLSAQASAETLIWREVSMRTFSSTLHDEKNHPIMIIDDLSKPVSIGEGRGAGGWVFLNNKIFDWKSNKELGMMRGMCFTVDHGPKGVFKGDVVIGAGGPFDAACQITYILKEGQIVAHGNMNLTALEQDNALHLAVTGGTGKFAGARGEIVFVQDPPGQPMTYKITVNYKK